MFHLYGYREELPWPLMKDWLNAIYWSQNEVPNSYTAKLFKFRKQFICEVFGRQILSLK